MPERKPGISRREFLKGVGAFAISKPLDMLVPEQVNKALISVNRNKLLLSFSPDTLPFSAKLNDEWSRFYDWESETPSVAEGMGTYFGESVFSYGQFKVRTDDIRQKLANKTVEEQELTPQLQTLYKLRNKYDNFVKEHPQYRFTPRIMFKSFLESQGYAGCIALKSPNDLGREGYLAIWNSTQETWSDYLPVIVLNTAQESSYERLKKYTRLYEDFTDISGEQIEFPWIVEVSSEVLNKASINPGSHLYRWVSKEAMDNYQIIFPHYKREEMALNYLYSDLGLRIRETTKSETFVSTVREIWKNKRLGQDNSKLGESVYIPHIYSFYDIPTTREIQDYKTLRDAMITPSSEIAGIPIGQQLQYQLFSNLNKGGVLDKRIVSDLYSDILFDDSAVFFLQDCKGGFGNETNAISGISTFEYGNRYFYFFQGKSLRRIELSQMILKLNNEKRIVFFG